MTGSEKGKLGPVAAQDSEGGSTSTPGPLSELIDAATLLTYPQCICCDCCDGYCPDWEDNRGRPSWYGGMVSLRLNGIEYIGRSVAMIRRDVLTPLPDTVEFFEPALPPDRTAWALVPDHRPPTSDRRQHAELLDQFDRAGITLHDGGDVTHLYVDDVHIGWAKWTTSDDGIGVGELPVVRRIANQAGISFGAAAKALRIARGQI